MKRTAAVFLAAGALLAAEGLPGGAAVRAGPALQDAQPARAALATPRPGREMDPALSALRADLDEVLAAPGWRRATWGVLAVSLTTGDTLFAREPGQPLAPASNVKLLTTAAALHYLGADYRFRTFVLADGVLDGGVLRGDVILYGTGDPGLSDRFYESRSAVMDSLAAALAARGVRRIEGTVVGDGTFFEGPDRVASWDPRDLNDWFAAASPALSFNENVVTVRVEATAPGYSPRVHTLPDQDGVFYRNEALTVPGRPRSRLLIEREDPAAPIRITGEMAASGSDVWRRMTVGDPVLFAAHALHQALGRAGIEVTGGAAAVTRQTGGAHLTATRLFRAGGGDAPTILAQHVSPPLSAYLEVINQESHNLFADLVLRTMGRVVEGEGSYEAGSRAVERFLTDEVGLPEGAAKLVDGSGLSSENRASPGTFVALLAHMAGHPQWETYWASLPEAGSRQLRRMQRTLAAGNLRAKTGTIEGVSALSGVVRTAGGDRVAFSIMGNALPSAWGAKRLEDRIGARLAAWMRSTEPFMASPSARADQDRTARDDARRP